MWIFPLVIAYSEFLQFEISISFVGAFAGFIGRMVALMAVQAPQWDSGAGKGSIYSNLKENSGVSELFACLCHCSLKAT